MIHKVCMPVYIVIQKIVAGGRDVKIEGSTRGPRGPKKLALYPVLPLAMFVPLILRLLCRGVVRRVCVRE